MSYLFEYLLFAAKMLTVLALVAVPVVAIVALRQGRRGSAPPLEIRRLNERLQDTRLALEAALLPAKQFKQHVKAAKAEAKSRDRGDAPARARSFVYRFDGDLRASAVEDLREIVTAVLAVAAADDEFVVVLESGGGTIHGYGLAASQLARVRDHGLRLRVVVDRIAASGGYMMACVANELVAAPFAIIGSIGVVAQLPNFNRLLKKHDIDFEQVTAGEFKRTLTVFGENTDAGRDKFQSEIDDAHALFKDFVARFRPALDLGRVATGEWWFATRALELGLVDRLATSDDILSAAAVERDVFEVSSRRRRSLGQRLVERARALLSVP